MTQINPVSLAGVLAIGYPAQMTQVGANECGAYALVAALAALGLLPTRNDIDISYIYAGVQANNSTITPSDDYQTLASSIYAVTGVLRLTLNGVTNSVNVQRDGYNSPAALAEVAGDLGCTTIDINITAAAWNNGNGQLPTLYPNEYGNCEEVALILANINVTLTVSNAAVYAAPAPGQTQLICVQTAGGGLHWLSRGQDATTGATNYYDSASGQTNLNWLNATDLNGVGGVQNPSVYTFTGLWMNFSM